MASATVRPEQEASPQWQPGEATRWDAGLFAVTEPNQVWCGDVTYIWTGKRWAYLAVVLDLFARKPVGWAMSFSPDSRLTMKALEMAWETRGKPVGVMFQAIKAVIIRAGSSGSYCGDTGSGRV